MDEALKKEKAAEVASRKAKLDDLLETFEARPGSQSLVPCGLARPPCIRKLTWVHFWPLESKYQLRC